MSQSSRRVEILRRKDTLADLMEEVRPYIGMPSARRDLLFQQVCLLAEEVLRSRPDRDAVLRWEAPVPLASRLLWTRLLERCRDASADR